MCANCAYWEGRTGIPLNAYLKSNAMCFASEKLTLYTDTCNEYMLYLDEMGITNKLDPNTTIEDAVTKRRISPIQDTLEKSERMELYKERTLLSRILMSKTEEESQEAFKDYVVLINERNIKNGDNIT